MPLQEFKGQSVLHYPLLPPLAWLCLFVWRYPPVSPNPFPCSLMWQMSLACQLTSWNLTPSFTAHIKAQHAQCNSITWMGYGIAVDIRQIYEPQLHWKNFMLALDVWEHDTEAMFSMAHCLLMCFLPCRPFQGDLPSWSRIHILALWCADFSQTAGRRWFAEHRSIMGGAESYLSSASILPAFTACSRWATIPHLPTDTASASIPWVTWDTTSHPGHSDSAAASPSLSPSHRDT